MPAQEKIDPELLRGMVEEFDKVFREFGPASLETGIAQVAKLFRALLGPMEQIKTREDTLRLCAQLPQPSAEEMQFIVGISQALPQLVTAMLKFMAEDMASQYPIQTSGRPKSLDRESRAALCDYIGRLYGSGVELRIAKKRAAQKFGISLSTVNRAWAVRKHPEREKPSIPEMLKFLST